MTEAIKTTPARSSAKTAASSRKPARTVSFAADTRDRAPATVPPGLFVASSPWSTKLILTLDGGGIRGYSALIILRALMREIADIEEHHEKPAPSSADTELIPRDSIPDHVYRKGQYLPSHYFDYIAGTSFGGLIAIMLGVMGMSVQECIDQFNAQQESIPLTTLTPAKIDFKLRRRRTTWPPKRSSTFYDTFALFKATATATVNADANAGATAITTTARVSGAPSSPVSLSSVASSVFKKDVFQCQTLAWCTEIEGHRPYAFRSYEDYESANMAISIPDVAKAITAPNSAPFKPFKLGTGHFVDGSRQVRDPTLEVLKEISELLDSDYPAIDLVLSLGTDEQHSWMYETMLKVLQPPSSNKNRAQAASGADVMIGREQGRSYQRYHRFEVPDIRLGLFRRRRFLLRDIEDATVRWLHEETNAADVRRYAEALVRSRRARAATADWETFALGARYLCFHDGCPQRGTVFDTRGEFYRHLNRRHSVADGMKGRAAIDAELDKGRTIGYAIA